MLRLFFIFLLANLTTPVLAQTPPASLPSSLPVLAEVNSIKILKSTLESELEQEFGSTLFSMELNQLNFLRKRYLAKMIDRELMRQAILQKHPQGNIEELWDNYLQEHVWKDVAISDAELSATYLSSAESLRRPAEVQLRLIFFKIDEDGSNSSQQRVLAESILMQLKDAPASFEELAKQYSQGTSSAKGGLLNYVSQNQLEKSIADAAFALAPGELSNIIVVKQGLAIIKVENRRGGNVPTFEEAKERLEQQLYQQKRERALSQYVARLRQQAKVIVYLK